MTGAFGSHPARFAPRTSPHHGAAREGRGPWGRAPHLHAGAAAGRAAVLAAEAPLRALVLRVVVPLAEADQAFARRALGQHERAVSLVVALAAETSVSRAQGGPLWAATPRHCADGRRLRSGVAAGPLGPVATPRCWQGSEVRPAPAGGSLRTPPRCPSLHPTHGDAEGMAPNDVRGPQAAWPVTGAAEGGTGGRRAGAKAGHPERGQQSHSGQQGQSQLGASQARQRNDSGRTVRTGHRGRRGREDAGSPATRPLAEHGEPRPPRANGQGPRGRRCGLEAPRCSPGRRGPSLGPSG